MFAELVAIIKPYCKNTNLFYIGLLYGIVRQTMKQQLLYMQGFITSFYKTQKFIKSKVFYKTQYARKSLSKQLSFHK